MNQQLYSPGVTNPPSTSTHILFLFIINMPISREERDAWCILLGDTQERLNLIHAEADAMRSRLEAEGRGSTARWPSVSDDDDEFEDCTPMTPPMTPPMSSSSGLSSKLHHLG